MSQTTYTSQYGAGLPARVYSAGKGKSRYSLTVVDYSQNREGPHGQGAEVRRQDRRVRHDYSVLLRQHGTAYLRYYQSHALGGARVFYETLPP